MESRPNTQRKSSIFRRKSSAYGIEMDVLDHSDRKPSLMVFFAALAALMGALSKGSVFGWSAPALEDMSRPNSVPHVTDEQTKSWIGSVITLGALAGGFISGPLIQYIGRRKAIISYGIPFSVGWLLIILAKSVLMIIAGRVLTGFCCGLVSAAIPTYIIEISTPNVRGLLGSAFQMCMVSGILLTFVFGSFLNWNHLAIVGLLSSVMMTVLMVFAPDSPNWLFNKYNNIDIALDSLRKLRTSDSDLLTEIKELERSVANTTASESNTSFRIWAQLKRPELFKPFLISMFVMFFQQASGVCAIEFFTTQIFQEAGSSLTPSLATIVVGVALVLATGAGSVLSDRLGRRPLLLVSGVGYAVSAGLMGFYYYQYPPHSADQMNSTLRDTISATISPIAETSGPHAVSSVGWLPILSCILYVISFGIGFGPIGWMLFAEICPSYAIGFVSSAVSCVHWLTAFAISYNFATFEHMITCFGTFWMFAAISALSVVFVVVFVPETKGLSKDEINVMFAGNRRLSVISAKAMRRDSHNHHCVTRI